MEATLENVVERLEVLTEAITQLAAIIQNKKASQPPSASTLDFSGIAGHVKHSDAPPHEMFDK